MCGIVGYTGSQPAQEIVLESLKKLEYRGYDSSGTQIATKLLSLYLYYILTYIDSICTHTALALL